LNKLCMAVGTAGIVLTLILPMTAQAAGALAVGRCNRHGYTYGYASMAAAGVEALARCASNGDQTCHVVVAIRGACAAFAVSGTCGPRGWAYAPSRGAAEQLAINLCIREGGTECTVQRWLCDGG
jgi:hypothetical protein